MFLDQKNRHIVDDWLSHLDFDVKQRDLSETRAEGTGKWLLDEPAFKEWLNGTQHILLCAGDRKSHYANGVYFLLYADRVLAGVGKSVLA